MPGLEDLLRRVVLAGEAGAGVRQLRAIARQEAGVMSPGPFSMAKKAGPR